MKNLSVYLLLILLVFTSACEKDDISTTEERSPKLIKVSEITTSGTEIVFDGYIIFEYGKNNFVSKEIASGGYTLDYIYNSNDQIVQVIYNDDEGDSYSIDYAYSNDLIISETYNDGNPTLYEYDSSGQLTSLETNQEKLFLNYDSNGNIKEKILDSEIRDSYQYDNMTNPTSLLYPEAYNKIKLNGPNNVIYRENGERTTTYQYNSTNLPISSVHTLTGFVQTREYTYE